jgi:protein-L-isoaspartate(D-aspartate) O-methyltransferase
VPPALVDQLAVGGRLVIPVGEWSQDLMLIERTEKGVTRRSVLPVRFVPMTGEAQKD